MRILTLNNAFSVFIIPAIFVSAIYAGERVDTARPIPATRPEMKQLLEDMKVRPPRIPLPELKADERQQLGERATDYETRLRFHYLTDSESSVFGSRPGSVSSRAGSSPAGRPGGVRDLRRNSDENMSLTYEFKTKLFWIVSRTNNCQYCLGHQEQKLAASGVAEDTIAALDIDWESFPPAEQAAFVWARKLTWTPHQIHAIDIELLRQHYTQLQILEMTTSIAGNNAINRWKEGTGVPQSAHGTRFFENTVVTTSRVLLPIDTFLTPTALKFQKRPSVVATLELSAKGESSYAIVANSVNETAQQVRAQLQQMTERRSRLPLCSADETCKVLGIARDVTPPAWMRLLANFPNESLRRIDSLIHCEVGELDLSELDRERVNWVVARQDRAWYAVAHALQRLKELGQSEAQIFELDRELSGLSEAERALLVMAKRLASSPITLRDEDVALVLKLSGPRKATQLINHVTSRAYFNRVTEAAGLSTTEDFL